MKSKLFLSGIFSIVLVFGMMVASCSGVNDSDDNGYGYGYEMLNGVWDRGDIVVTFNDSTGVFTQINSTSGWITLLNNGTIHIGDQKFRNITKSGDLKWTCQEKTYPSSTSTGWVDSTITMDSDGRTFRSYSSNTNPTTSTYTKK
ncbi:hypothetical protein ACYULU_05215 [Breznakiellaceae bacterium SP9]